MDEDSDMEDASMIENIDFKERQLQERLIVSQPKFKVPSNDPSFP
jgi:hypothetical protein